MRTGNLTLLGALPWIFLTSACGRAIQNSEESPIVALEDSADGDRSGTRLKRILLHTADGASFPWTTALWDIKRRRPCHLQGALAGEAGGPYCLDTQQNVLPSFADTRCSVPAARGWGAFIVPSGCDYRVSYYTSRIGPGFPSIYRHAPDGRCELVPGGSSEGLPGYSAQIPVPRLHLSPASGAGRLRPWKVVSEDGLRITSAARGVYDTLAQTSCKLGGRTWDDDSDECRVVAPSPALDTSCERVVGVSTRPECADAPPATRAANVAASVDQCTQTIFSHDGTMLLSGAETYGERDRMSCVRRNERTGEQLMTARASFRAATFRRVVGASTGRLHPVLAVDEAGHELGVERYWDEAQGMDCRIETFRDYALCVPLSEATRFVWRDASCSPSTVLVAFYSTSSCAPLPKKVLARPAADAADPWRLSYTRVTEVEVLPAPSGDYYVREQNPSGKAGEVCSRIVAPRAIVGANLRTVEPVPLTIEIR